MEGSSEIGHVQSPRTQTIRVHETLGHRMLHLKIGGIALERRGDLEHTISKGEVQWVLFAQWAKLLGMTG